ncbi:hypothetical protein [Microbacterium testaceum]|uniref:hypothetical protein n=1 Tax=Microbacterium testaceum TaxID=2033 RepID=UPI002AC46C03|nr:hypothetical protein [Microbacterium testaceum]MDZ5144011.1 hypothetical protein [Microbacterium testaceum]
MTVTDDQDFLTVHHKPEFDIRCPDTACGSRLTPKQNRSGTRWLAARPGEVRCDHHLVSLQPPSTAGRGGGGGEETPEHRWMKARIARVCAVMGFDAFVEHAPTHADVFVADPGLALEYQRWDTAFALRDNARRSAGATQTIWFFPEPPRRKLTKAESARARVFREQVFQRGGVFITAAHQDDAQRIQKPWERPGDAELNRSTRLYVSASVVVYDRQNGSLKYARALPFHKFIRDVARGDRTLQDVRVRLKDGSHVRRRVWVLASDLEKVMAGRQKARKSVDGDLIVSETSVRDETVDAGAARSEMTGDRPQPAMRAAVETPRSPAAAGLEALPAPPQETAIAPPGSTRETPQVAAGGASTASVWAKLRQWLAALRTNR